MGSSGINARVHGPTGGDSQPTGSGGGSSLTRNIPWRERLTTGELSVCEAGDRGERRVRRAQARWTPSRGSTRSSGGGKQPSGGIKVGSLRRKIRRTPQDCSRQ